VAEILPATGPKGAALAIVMDVLCGPLGSGLMGINNQYQPGNASRDKIATAPPQKTVATDRATYRRVGYWDAVSPPLRWCRDCASIRKKRC